jgi:hypothetical protein
MPLVTVADTEAAALEPEIALQDTLVLRAMTLHERKHCKSSRTSKSKLSRNDDEPKISKHFAKRLPLLLLMDW